MWTLLHKNKEAQWGNQIQAGVYLKCCAASLAQVGGHGVGCIPCKSDGTFRITLPKPWPSANTTSLKIFRQFVDICLLQLFMNTPLILLLHQRVMPTC